MLEPKLHCVPLAAVLLLIGSAGCKWLGGEKNKALIIFGETGETLSIRGTVSFELQNGTLRPNLLEKGMLYVLRHDVDLSDGAKGKAGEIFIVDSGGRFKRKGFADLKLTDDQLAEELGVIEKSWAGRYSRTYVIAGAGVFLVGIAAPFLWRVRTEHRRSTPLVPAGSVPCHDATPATGMADSEMPPPNGRFRDNGDGSVLDQSTGLCWEQVTCPKELSYEGALAYCRQLRIGGHDDWRLPSVDELRSLLIEGTAGTSELFMDAKAERYWSNVSYVSSRSSGQGRLLGYVFDFQTGEPQTYYREYEYYVRAVR